MDHMSSVAIMGLALLLSWEAYQDPGLEDAQLAELFRRWQQVNLLGEVAHVTEMERACQRAFLMAASDRRRFSSNSSAFWASALETRL